MRVEILAGYTERRFRNGVTEKKPKLDIKSVNGKGYKIEIDWKKTNPLKKTVVCYLEVD